jgi:nucleotidyltransferase/DNA polymerase involved in DNA repair
VAGTHRLFGPPVELAKAIRRRVRAEVGLPISVGVAHTKHLAKIASQVAKPDALVVVDPAMELTFLHNLPVELMWAVGPVTKARLVENGVLTIGQLGKLSPAGVCSGCLAAHQGSSWRRWRGIAIHAKAGRSIEPDRPEPNRRSGESQLKSAFFSSAAPPS